MSKEVIMQIEHVNKSFGATIALSDVSMEIRRGEIRGLIGENGSGKSTVTSIAAGMQKADSGTFVYKGQPWDPNSMLEAQEHGIGMIVQESGTVPGITVAENIFLGETGQFRKGIAINRKAMMQEAQKVLDDAGAGHIRAECPTAALDMQDRKLVEIAKVMRKNPEILVVDETTTALSQKGRDIIYAIMNRMKDENKAVVFISHDLDEITSVCDALTVLRDGRIIVTFEKAEFDDDKIKKSMIGRDLKGDYYRSDYNDTYGDEAVLEVKDVTVPHQLENLSLTLHKGEILGIGGLSDCGMHTLGKVMFGALKPESGEVVSGDTKVKDEETAMKLNIGYVSKDRDYESLNLNASIQDNIAIGGIDRFKVGKFLVLPPNEKKYVEKQIDGLSIKCQGRKQYVSALSGGNKQKVVFGKWIGRDSEILILDCPTRGVDIGVKQAMYQLMYKMKTEGKSIVIISEEMAELLGMADRIVVLRDGKAAGEVMRHERPDEASIIQWML